ncbi:MAG: arylesterase [Gammaproteobacteria bacterium]|nr:MAG: arylesterase [Gammaproteobacteria bacterium]
MQNGRHPFRWAGVLLLGLLWVQPGWARTLLILGDSLSAAHGIPQSSSWVQQVTIRLETGTSPVKVVNASISGETTRGGLARLPALLGSHQPDWVLIELGANDGLRGFPPVMIRRNLTALIETVREHGAEPLLMQIMLPPTYGKRYVEAFQSLYPSVAEAHNVPLLPFLLTPLAERPDLFQEDGLHPTAEAQPLIADFVLDALFRTPMLKNLTHTVRN